MWSLEQLACRRSGAQTGTLTSRVTLPDLSMDKRPRVSVCIPVFNGATYLASAIESVMSQTFRDFELVILDNCSTDGTAEVAARFAGPRVRVLRHRQNIGVVANWNRALLEARGKYLKIVCADDRLLPDCLSRQVALLDEFPDAGMVACARQVIDSRGNPLLARRYPGRSGSKSGAEVIRKCTRWGTNLLGEPVAVLFRTDLIPKAGEFDGNYPYLIDLSYWFKLARLQNIIVQRDILAEFRVSAESWSVQIGQAQAQQFSEFTKCILLNRESPISRFDHLLGTSTARINCRLRQLVYWKNLPFPDSIN
jgi:glycosyltransferase involved in cell wall biosynthesis